MSGSIWRESHRLHCASQAASRPFPRHTRARVEVEHHAVGMFERCRAGVQRVNLDDVPLRRREQALLACHLAMLDVADPWRLGGSRIPEKSERREAFNIMLSMPRGTDPVVVQRAAREFAQAELGGHRYVMVLHDHQANSLRASERACRIAARQTAQPAQGRPAALARDLCREVARLGHRRRSHASGHAGRAAKLPDDVARKGASARDTPTSNIHDEVRGAVLDQPQAST